MPKKGTGGREVKNYKSHFEVKRKPQWDGSISDLKSYKLTPHELAARKERMASSNVNVVRRLMLGQRIDKARRAGGVKDGVFRELLPNSCALMADYTLADDDDGGGGRGDDGGGGSGDGEGGDGGGGGGARGGGPTVCSNQDDAENDDGGGGRSSVDYEKSDNDDECADNDDEKSDNDDDRDDGENEGDDGGDEGLLKQVPEISKLPSLVFSLCKHVQQLEGRLAAERRNRHRLQARLSAVSKTCADLQKQLTSLFLHSSNLHPPLTSSSSIIHSSCFPPCNVPSDSPINSITSSPSLPSSFQPSDLTQEQIESRLQLLASKQTQTYLQLRKLNLIQNH